MSVLLLNTGQARAQEVWGYSDVYYDPNYDWISAIAVTTPDYSTQYYYTAKVDISLEGTDGFGAGSTCGGYPLSCDMGGWAWAGLVATPTPGAKYTTFAQHRLGIYWLYVDFEPVCYPYCGAWYDGLGFTYPFCSPECMADPFCYCVESTASPPTDRWWTAPMILALVYFSERWFDPTSDEEVAPVPVLEVRNDNVPISEGQTVTITAGNASSSPQMPALTARLVGPSVTGNTTWRMETVYTDHARSDADAFPSAPRVLPSTSVWDIRSDTGGTIRGGTATVRYTYNNRPELTFSFQIRGTNASEADARARLGASPWFLTRIARQESGIRQFDSGGAPVFGSPNGWGLMQLDPPPGSSEIWSWWANVDAGKAVVNQKNAELTPTWNTRVSEWNSWNQAHPNQQVPAPSPRQEANCDFHGWVEAVERRRPRASGMPAGSSGTTALPEAII